MTSDPSPSTGPTTATSAAASTRRRQRSTRILVSVLLLVLAALLVLGAVVSGSWLVLVLAAVAGVALGAAATRITNAELAEARRGAAQDRSEQARSYRALTDVRVAEQADFVTTMTRRIADNETRTTEQALQLADAEGTVALQRAGITSLERRLADATSDLDEARERLETEKGRLELRLEDADERAAQAIVRVAELEQELDFVLAEWRATGTAPQRKHA